ncbi:addiction module toxin RelE [Candidatus Uhrbacteria bacterium]|nr:addiction module toxin RelE [Candidatus Uhrbacteria bacterium]
MRDLNGNFSQWFNVVHDRVGHLFQGRYRAFVIERETYFLEVARYIVLNAVRADLVVHPKDWKWSSYRATSGAGRVPEWLYVDWLLGNFSKQKRDAQQDYRTFVEEGIGGKNPYDEVTNGFLLGSPQFVNWIWEKTNGSEKLKEHPRDERIVGRLSLEEIFADVKTKQERNDAIILARIRCGYLNSEIARPDPTTATSAQRC